MKPNGILPLVTDMTFVVVDFETVTPKGRPPEPLELAALRLEPGLVLDPTCCFSWLIRPPADAPLTEFDTRQTGIRAQDIVDAPDAATVLHRFDEHLGHELPVLVAHNARYEAAIFRRFAHHCPQAAALSFLDTVALSKHMVPGLPNYKLDTLAHHFGLAIPADRHRALPDVALTLQVLLRLLRLSLDHAPQAIRGYCLAVRASLTDDGRSPLDAPGLRLYERVSQMSDSIGRVREKKLASSFKTVTPTVDQWTAGDGGSVATLAARLSVGAPGGPDPGQ